MAAPRLARLAGACALALLLAACAGPPQEAPAPAAPASAAAPVAVPVQPAAPAAPTPAPAPQAASPAEPEHPGNLLLGQGMASWYGPGLHGRRTASGERFDRFGFTAAHRTLPFGTRVCVRSLVTGKTVMVRINDRGPFGADDRVVDLSQGAAKALGMIGLGIKPVELWQADEGDTGCVPALGGGAAQPSADQAPVSAQLVAPRGAPERGTERGR